MSDKKKVTAEDLKQSTNVDKCKLMKEIIKGTATYVDNKK